MLSHFIFTTYFYIYFNQFGNVLQCYVSYETTVRVRRPAGCGCYTHTTQTAVYIDITTVTTQGSYMK